MKAFALSDRGQHAEREPGSAVERWTYTELVTAPIECGTRHRRGWELYQALRRRGLDGEALAGHLSAWLAWHAPSLGPERTDESRAQLDHLMRKAAPRMRHRVISIPAGAVSAAERSALSADARELISRAPRECRPEVEAILARCEPYAGQLRGLGKRALTTIAGDRCSSHRGADGARKRLRLRVRAVEWLRECGYLTAAREYQIGAHVREYLIADAGPSARPSAFAMEALPEPFRAGPGRAMPPERPAVEPAELPAVALASGDDAYLEPASDDPMAHMLTAAVAAMLVVTSENFMSVTRTAFEASATRTHRGKRGKRRNGAQSARKATA